MKRRRRKTGLAYFFILHTWDQNNWRVIKVSNSFFETFFAIFRYFNSFFYKKKNRNAAPCVDWRRNKVIKVGNHSWGILQEKNSQRGCWAENRSWAKFRSVGGVRDSGPIRVQGLTQAKPCAPAWSQLNTEGAGPHALQRLSVSPDISWQLVSFSGEANRPTICHHTQDWQDHYPHLCEPNAVWQMRCKLNVAPKVLELRPQNSAPFFFSVEV